MKQVLDALESVWIINFIHKNIKYVENVWLLLIIAKFVLMKALANFAKLALLSIKVTVLKCVLLALLVQVFNI